MIESIKESMELRPAGPFARAVALAVDELIRWMMILAGLYLLAAIGALSLGKALVLIFIVYWLYGVMFDVLCDGQTPGKRAQHIGVVNADGTPVHFGASLIRNLLWPIDALPFAYLLGLITMMVTERFRRIGDLAAATLVVFRQPACEPWEAADRGCVIVRDAPRSLYGAWFVTAVPIFVLTVVLLWSYPGASGFLLWWLKPLYERLPMWIARQRADGRAPNVLEAAAEWRQFCAGLLATLTYRRLSPTRSFDVCVDVVEGSKASIRSARVALLHQRSGSPALWLTVICAHIEAFLVTAAVMALLWLAPHPKNFDLMSLVTWVDSNQFGWATNLVYLIAIGLVGPVYAAAGFTLYANRCSELETAASEARQPIVPARQSTTFIRRTID